MTIFKHPTEVCMTYIKHLKFSLGISILFLEGFYKAFIHAFIPDVYIKSTSNIVQNISHKLDNSGCRK